MAENLVLAIYRKKMIQNVLQDAAEDSENENPKGAETSDNEKKIKHAENGVVETCAPTPTPVVACDNSTATKMLDDTTLDEDMVKKVTDLLKRKVKVEKKKLIAWQNMTRDITGLELASHKTATVEIACWLLIIVVFTIMTVYGVIWLFLRFRDEPTVTNVRMDYANSRVLPNATLCMPFYIDEIENDPETDPEIVSKEYRTNWTQIADTMNQTLNKHNQNFTEILTCPNTKIDSIDKNEKVVTIRLIGEDGVENNKSGRLELNLNGIWGTICGDYWGIEEATVSCRMLGYPNAKSKVLMFNGAGLVPQIVWGTDFGCKGNESSLGECPFGGWGVHQCHAMEAAGVDCVGETVLEPWETEKIPNYLDVPKDEIEVRLVDEWGRVSNSHGRVELKLGGIWGTVCNDGWDLSDARVVCHMLAWPWKDVSVLDNPHLSISDGPIWSCDVNCTGNETHIKDCPMGWYASAPVAKCSNYHEQDAGVDCNGQYLRERKAMLFTGGAVLARLTAIETDEFSGEAAFRPFRWSTSDLYWKGEKHKDAALHILLQIMDKAAATNDLPRIRELVGCELCKFVSLKPSFYKMHTLFEDVVSQCADIKLSWINSVDNTACVKIPFGMDRFAVSDTKDFVDIRIDLENLYPAVQWDSIEYDNSSAYDNLNAKFRLDFNSERMVADKVAPEVVQIYLGKERMVAIQVTQIFQPIRHCTPAGHGSCVLQCQGKEMAISCSDRCIPGTWKAYIEELEPWSWKTLPYCMLEDYTVCYNGSGENEAAKACAANCFQSCQYIMYKLRTVSEESLHKVSMARLSIHLGSTMYPIIQEEYQLHWFNLMSEFGGALSLWLGTSFFGLMHCAWYLFADIYRRFLGKKIRKRPLKYQGATRRKRSRVAPVSKSLSTPY